MIYLDTGCLVKLYHPEPDSEAVARLVRGEVIALVGIHELELTNALQLMLFRKEARPTQVRAARALLDEDIRVGTLHRPTLDWNEVLRQSRDLAAAHTRRLGCRSLDIVHCAAARELGAKSFVTTDRRQRGLAVAIGLHCPSV
jgi:predicted nucleic acid-binding protein